MERRDFVKSLASLITLKQLFIRVAESQGVRSTAHRIAGQPMRAKTSPYFGVFQEVSPASIKPLGWLRGMLDRQLNGLARNHFVSGYPYDTCLWTGVIAASDHGESWWPYEQSAYLIDGLARLGLLTEDAGISSEVRANVDYILQHPRPDGSLGPSHIGETNWPHAVVFRGLLAEFHAHGNPDIPQAIARHYLSRPDTYGEGRDVANVEIMLSVYASTKDARLLAKARATYENFDRSQEKTCLAKLSNDRPIYEHGVTFNETAKLPALLYLHTGDSAMLDASLHAYHKLDRDHMLASGLHSAEEGTKGNTPDLYHETCNVSDYTWSLGYLLMATGDASFADRIEKTIFNAGMGSISKDFRSHQYFSTPNQVVAAQGIRTIFDDYRVAYRPGHQTECCSGNVHRFLPNYALRQWMQTPSGGVVAALYGASRLASKIDGVPVTIDQVTEYPFSEEIHFTIQTPVAKTFSLHLRIPRWATGATIYVNGKAWPGLCSEGSFETVTRTFKTGDVVTLHLPMQVHMHHWGGNAVSIERGPLVYSLKIAEDAKPVRGFKTTEDFPAWDIRPASPWNYGLALKEYNVPQQVQVVKRTIFDNPWDTGNSPIEIQVPAMKIDNWNLPSKENPRLPEKPTYSGATETVTLVPYGGTRIRLTAFPLV
jgi:hypothetical protein